MAIIFQLDRNAYRKVYDQQAISKTSIDENGKPALFYFDPVSLKYLPFKFNDTWEHAIDCLLAIFSFADNLPVECQEEMFMDNGILAMLYESNRVLINNAEIYNSLNDKDDIKFAWKQVAKVAKKVALPEIIDDDAIDAQMKCVVAYEDDVKMGKEKVLSKQELEKLQLKIIEMNNQYTAEDEIRRKETAKRLGIKK